MSLVSFALRRPVSLIVAVAAVVLAGALALTRMSRDIFPDLGVPVIYVAQPYGGMDAAQMEGFIVNYYEYHFLYITGIEHVESQSIQGVGLIKLQFHPGTNMAQAMAETVSYVNRSRAFMPAGTVPPFVMRFDAGSVPVGNLVFSSDDPKLGLKDLQDAALFKVRPMFATLPGVSAPPPFGGSQRSVVVRVDPERLRAQGLSTDEVAAAVARGNTISPSGNVRIGDQMPMVPVNSVVTDVKELGWVPVRLDTNPPVYVKDVATVEDSSDIQTGYALVNGRRTVYIPVTKRADASTLDVVNLVKENLPKFQSLLPEGVKVSYEFDQSPYVTRAIWGLTVEGALGALLTGAMVLLFLRDWRSAVVVVVNIPLSIVAACLALWASGQTVNIMTLGGLALAVGILVDEATVTIENVHTHLARGQPLARAALDATRETTLPRLLAMLCVLAVFIPAFVLTGAARSLFVPLALAVGFSMVASYLLSSTLVPVLSVWLLRGGHANGHTKRLFQNRREPRGSAAGPSDPAGRETTSESHADRRGPAHAPARAAFFERLRGRYERAAGPVVRRRWVVVPAYLVVCTLLILLVGGHLGTEIFPRVDTGQFQLRLRAPAGTRIERTEKVALETLAAIEREVGAGNVAVTLGFVGVQPATYPVNTIHLWTAGPEEAVLQVQLRPGAKVRVEELKERLRQKLPDAMREKMPELAGAGGVQFSFEPGDIVSRVMSFGSPTPVQVAVSGPNFKGDREFADKLRDALSGVPTLRDLQYEQELEYPAVKVTVDRERAGTMGVTASDVGEALVAGTSSTRYTRPVFWADPKSGVGYQVQVQVPEAKMNSLEQVKNLPVSRKGGPLGTSGVRHFRRSGTSGEPAGAVDLRNVAGVAAGTVMGEYDRYNMQRTLSLTANVSGEDLGRTTARVERAVAAAGAPPPRVSVAVRGQATPLREMLGGLRTGLLVAVGAVFLLLAANFQSFKLSLAVVLTVPAVVAGSAVALALTGTTLNIQSFMGTIMAVGVAVANAILLVTFAERRRRGGALAGDAAGAALEGAPEPPPPDPHDEPGDDGRHDPHGGRLGRRRRADRPPRPGRRRRPRRRDAGHAVRPAGGLRAPPAQRRPRVGVARPRRRAKRPLRPRPQRRRRGGRGSRSRSKVATQRTPARVRPGAGYTRHDRAGAAAPGRPPNAFEAEGQVRQERKRVFALSRRRTDAIPPHQHPGGPYRVRRGSKGEMMNSRRQCATLVLASLAAAASLYVIPRPHRAAAGDAATAPASAPQGRPQQSPPPAPRWKRSGRGGGRGSTGSNSPRRSRPSSAATCAPGPPASSPRSTPTSATA